MTKKKIDRKSIHILVIILIFLVFFSVLFWYVFSDGTLISAETNESEYPEEQIIPDTTTQAPETILISTHINIPSIGVNAAIEQVALAQDGSMDVPKDPLNAGWYELGPKPGEIGSAVIAGHLNWFDGVVGVFADLSKIQPGDTIILQDNECTDITFIVRETKMYNAEEDATDVFSSTDGKAHLNLVTCDGIWNKNTAQYSQRLVVFADRETE